MTYKLNFLNKIKIRFNIRITLKFDLKHTKNMNYNKFEIGWP